VLSGEKGPPLITLRPQKLELIQEQGIEVVICLPFNQELAQMEPEDFVYKILVGRIGIKELVIGYDYRFGRKARGDREMLIQMGRDYGFEVHTVSPQPGPDGRTVHSTLIRQMVMEGRVDQVPQYLGRHYRIAGRVVRGRDRGGKMLGFPTANLRLEDELVPQTGVYAVLVTCRGATYSGVANIGYNPTFGDVALSVEVHCFDFQDDIYDELIKVDFVERIRPERKFGDPTELADQIKRDCTYARRLLEEKTD
jgi:riboflavin kinase/FMN adenylyltransferase